jgi:uncharacterized protein (DUF433 family)
MLLTLAGQSDLRGWMMPATAYAHIEIRNGVPYLEGTQTKVVEVALDQIGSGWDALAIHEQHPHLSLGQIHSALAYYHDHKAELDQDIERRARQAEELRSQVGKQFTRAELEERLKERKEAKQDLPP